jgi:hypothetical protein
VLGFDFDAVALEEVEGIFGKAFVEHRENLRSYIIDCDLDLRYEGWVELFEILLAEVKELRGELNAGG